MKTNEHTKRIYEIDDGLRDFLKEVRSGQCMSLAAWAAEILRVGAISMNEIERCFVLGFEG